MNSDEFKNIFPNGEQFERLTKAVEAIAAGQLTDPDVLDRVFAASMDCTNTTQIFKQWYPCAKAIAGASLDRYKLLERFFKMMAEASADIVFTVRGIDSASGSTTELTPLGDLANLSAAQLCTEATTEVADWADEHPLAGWYIRFIGTSNADGSMNVLAIEGVDDDIDLSGETAPLYTASMSYYKREYIDSGYWYKSIRANEDSAGLFYLPEEALTPDGERRYMLWHATTPGTLDSNGYLTSGIGGAAAVFNSESSGLTKVRNKGAYEGLMTDCDSTWALDMWQFRHLNKENSNIAEGCLNYNYQYLVAAAESDVKRVLLSTSNAANLVVGSALWVGDPGSSTNYDRGQAHMRNIVSSPARITAIESVTIDGTTYAAVYLELDSTITTTATTRISTAPWHTGSTDALPGHKDGCLHSLTAGKGPLRVMGCEFLIGCYDIGADPLYQVTANATSGYDYAVYTVRDATKQATSVTSDYEDTGISYSGMPSGWQYVKDFVINMIGILFPESIGGSSSGWFKSAFNGSPSAGVRVPWRRCNLYHGGSGGLAGETGHNDPSSSYWFGSPRLGGSGKTRGKQAA